MSREYCYLNNFSNYGIMGISRSSFVKIAEIAANEVHGATVASKKKSLFRLDNPVGVSFRKDGKVDINIDVSIDKDASVKDVCLNIQHRVADAIMMMCETVSFDIKIKVSSIK